MAGPTFDAILSDLLKTGRIKPDDYAEFHKNYRYFQSRAPQIRAEYAGKWVAALNELLYNDNQGRRLIEKMLRTPGGRYAYIEQISEAV
jgi:hypothetical protein